LTTLGVQVQRDRIKEMMNKKLIIIRVIATLIICIAGFILLNKNQTNNMTKQVLLETSQGDITIELYSDMPVTAGNFEKLVKSGFYDGVIFHRIIDGFMIQGGDPLGNGMGGPGYAIKDEFTHAGGNRNDRGTIAMANSGPDTGGSQFFINLVDNNFLDSKHPAFGKIIDGMDVIDRIAKVQTDKNDKPLKDVVIISARMI
jgi:peptidylprolyl isomerase